MAEGSEKIGFLLQVKSSVDMFLKYASLYWDSVHADMVEFVMVGFCWLWCRCTRVWYQMVGYGEILCRVRYGTRGILGYDEYGVIRWSIMQVYQGMVGKVR